MLLGLPFMGQQQYYVIVMDVLKWCSIPTERQTVWTEQGIFSSVVCLEGGGGGGGYL